MMMIQRVCCLLFSFLAQHTHTGGRNAAKPHHQLCGIYRHDEGERHLHAYVTLWRIEDLVVLVMKERYIIDWGGFVGVMISRTDGREIFLSVFILVVFALAFVLGPD